MGISGIFLLLWPQEAKNFIRASTYFHKTRKHVRTYPFCPPGKIETEIALISIILQLYRLQCTDSDCGAISQNPGIRLRMNQGKLRKAFSFRQETKEANDLDG